MTISRRLAAPVVAALCLAAAAVLLLLAFDARAWGSRMTRDDLRFQTQHSHAGLWRSPSLLPGDPAGRLLGLGDALDYRRAMQLFWRSRVGTESRQRLDVNATRVDAANLLQRELDRGRTRGERSSAANLLGVLTMTTPLADTEAQTRLQTLRRAAGFFRRAISESQANYAAKENLELVLRIEKQDRSRFGEDARAGFGFGKGRGTTVTGSGY